MTWNLFIDDERDPPNDGRKWVVCRSYGDAMVEVLNRGFPNYISFDHDLGDDKYTGYELAKQLVENDIISGDRESRAAYKFPADFSYYVHSRNPIGKANIEGLLNGYMKAKARATEVPFNQARADELFMIAETDEEGDITVGKLK